MFSFRNQKIFSPTWYPPQTCSPAWHAIKYNKVSEQNLKLTQFPHWNHRKSPLLPAFSFDMKCSDLFFRGNRLNPYVARNTSMTTALDGSLEMAEIVMLIWLLITTDFSSNAIRHFNDLVRTNKHYLINLWCFLLSRLVKNIHLIGNPPFCPLISEWLQSTVRVFP